MLILLISNFYAVDPPSVIGQILLDNGRKLYEKPGMQKLAYFMDLTEHGKRRSDFTCKGPLREGPSTRYSLLGDYATESSTVRNLLTLSSQYIKSLILFQ